MCERYSYADLKNKLRELGIENVSRGKVSSKANSQERTERKIDGLCVINVPKTNNWFQIRLTDDLYRRILNDTSFNAEEVYVFPVEKCIDEDGRKLKLQDLSGAKRAEMEDAVDKLDSLKRYRDYSAADIQRYHDTKKLICIRNGAGERKTLFQKYPHIILLFNNDVLDRILEIIAEEFV